MLPFQYVCNIKIIHEILYIPFLGTKSKIQCGFLNFVPATFQVLNSHVYGTVQLLG